MIWNLTDQAKRAGVGPFQVCRNLFANRRVITQSALVIGYASSCQRSCLINKYKTTINKVAAKNHSNEFNNVLLHWDKEESPGNSQDVWDEEQSHDPKGNFVTFKNKDGYDEQEHYTTKANPWHVVDLFTLHEREVSLECFKANKDAEDDYWLFEKLQNSPSVVRGITVCDKRAGLRNFQ